MTFTYNCTGAERKKLITTISETINAPAKYLGAPSFSYQVGYFTVDRNSAVSCNDNADSDEVNRVTKRLTADGFAYESFRYDSEQQEPCIEQNEPCEDCPPPYGTPNGCTLSVEVPMDKAAIDNLTALLEAKGGLISKALGTTNLKVEQTEHGVAFPWFTRELAAEEIKAYTHFIASLCEMASTQKRITAKEKEVDNEKYAFRCFLLRLGFIGNEYKDERKILLHNLAGSSAFKSGAKEKEA